MTPEHRGDRARPAASIRTWLVVAGALTVAAATTLILLQGSGTSVPAVLGAIPDRVHAALLRNLPVWMHTRGLPGMPTGIVVVTLTAVVAGMVAGPRLAAARWRVTLWTWAVLVPTAATLTIPGHSSMLPSTFRWCTGGELPFPGMVMAGAPAEVVSNIVLFLPAGAVAMLWPAGVRRLAALLSALAIPAAIELTQLIPALHRACQGADVLNNCLGVLIGFAAAAGVEVAAASWRGARGVPGGSAR